MAEPIARQPGAIELKEVDRGIAPRRQADRRLAFEDDVVARIVRDRIEKKRLFGSHVTMVVACALRLVPQRKTVAFSVLVAVGARIVKVRPVVGEPIIAREQGPALVSTAPFGR